MAIVATLLPKAFADLGGQILSTFGSFHSSGNMWTVNEEVYSSSVSPASCVTERVEDIMPALQACRARKRKLRCDVSEIVQEPGSSPDLLMVHDCTEQDAHTRSDDKLRALLANQPICFALIFWVAEVPPFALLRSGSKVKNVTLHTPREVTLCWWPLLVAQHLPPAQDFVNRVLPVHS